MKKFKVINSLFIIALVCMLVFGYAFLGVHTVAATGIGNVKQTYSRTIMQGVTYTYTQSDNGSPQRNYVLEYDPVNSGVEAYAVFGQYEMGGDTISTNIALAQQRGYTVIAGVNASPFDTSNGVTVGTIIQNGVVISANSGRSGYDSFAINEDGRMFVGTSNLSFSYKVNGESEVSFSHINKQKKKENNDIYLLTSEFAEDTRILANSVEVALTIQSGIVGIGKEMVATVASINENATTSSRTKLASGKAVLVGPSLSAMGNLKVGDSLTFSIQNNDTEHDWSKVTQSICGFYEILKDGNLINVDGTDVHPRTTIGYKADGTIVLWVVDGRQPSFSVGLTDRACAEYMKSLGCVAAVRMDGGGSSNMTIRLPGDSKLTTVNSPSDGGERSDSDALLLVLRSDYNTNVGENTLLHAYPNSVTVLENTIVDLIVKATDDRYNPKTVPEYSMTVEGDCGAIIEGKFQAKTGTGEGKVKIAAGDSVTYVDVKVTNKVTELYATVNNIAAAPGEVRKLGVKAYSGSDLLECSNESFAWSCDPEIGSIDIHGKFTATKDAGKTGYIYVKHGTVTGKVLVTIGALPTEITGFETDKCGTGSGEWRNTQANGGNGSCSINTNLDYVKFGNKSLRIDFNLKGTTGTVGTQIGNGGLVKVEGTPTAIGMWVYATASAKGAWIRIQYQDAASSGGKYADFGHIDWTGWKYLEAPLDTTVTYPISVRYLVRIMGVTESERINGTIYVDCLRAVYGFKNDDFVSPTIENITPEKETYLTTQTISFDIKDKETGINKDATKFYYDGKLIDNIQVSEITDGYHVTWTPSALIPLPVGEHTFRVRFEDNFGNFIVKEWKINVLNKIPTFAASIPNEIKNRQGFEYVLSSKIDNFNSCNFEINYDKTGLKVEKVEGLSEEDYKLEEGKITGTYKTTERKDISVELIKVTFKPIAEGEQTIQATGKYDGTDMAALETKFTVLKGQTADKFNRLMEFVNLENIVSSRQYLVKAMAEKELLEDDQIDAATLKEYNDAITKYNQVLADMQSNIEVINKVREMLGGR